MKMLNRCDSIIKTNFATRRKFAEWRTAYVIWILQNKRDASSWQCIQFVRKFLRDPLTGVVPESFDQMIMMHLILNHKDQYKDAYDYLFSDTSDEDKEKIKNWLLNSYDDWLATYSKLQQARSEWFDQMTLLALFAVTGMWVMTKIFY